MDTRTETDELADLLIGKLAVLQQLRDLSRRQSDLIADNNMTRLLSVLSAKQTLLVELQKIQTRLKPFEQQDPATRTWRSPARRDHCRQVSESCEALLSEIMLVERQSEMELKQHRDAAARRLESSHSSSQATRAYLNSGPNGPQRLDIYSER